MGNNRTRKYRWKGISAHALGPEGRKELVIDIMDDAMADILRQKTPLQRLQIAGRMWQSARVMIRGSICTSHPEWTERQVNRELIRRISHGVIDLEAI